METKLLTYAELGAALGITPASAKRLAIRRGWPKQPGNDGKARVMVPLERLEEAKPVTSDSTSDDTGAATSDATSAVTGDISEAVTVLTRHIERLETELAAAMAERDTERARAAQVAVLEAVLEVERQRIAEAQAEAERWREMATAPRGLARLFTRRPRG